MLIKKTACSINLKITHQNCSSNIPSNILYYSARAPIPLFSNTHLFTELEETKVLENSGIGD